jgi:hypothetical protein
MSAELDRDWWRLTADWDGLELDRYLEAGATFRRRRYGRYYWSPGNDRLLALPAQPYFQPEDENPYAGGVQREFAPLLPETVSSPFLDALVRSTFEQLPLPSEKQAQTWEVRVHQIRIVTSADQPGKPAPEGIHQDGTDFLTLHMVRRSNVVGAESTIYDLERRPLASYTMLDPLDSFIIEDPRVMHGVTPVLPANGASQGTRDLLGLDFILRPGLQPPSDANEAGYL